MGQSFWAGPRGKEGNDLWGGLLAIKNVNSY